MGLNCVLEGFNLQENELFLHDSKLSIPLPLSIMFVNRSREVLDCSVREEVIGKDYGLQLACY